MPSNLPSSFASAAAGQNNGRASGRGDAVRGSGSGEWPRSNGTRTFRRPSTTPSSSLSALPNTTVEASQAPVPGSASNVSSAANAERILADLPSPPRYSKDELLDIYKHNPAIPQIDISPLLAATWNPTHANGNSTRSWGKNNDTSHHAPQDPTVCWDTTANVRPIGLRDMLPEERSMFRSDVNSIIKPIQQNKDTNLQAGGAGGGHGPNGRKPSLSTAAGLGNFATGSPSPASRPNTRRRETTDTNPFPAGGLTSPTTSSRFSRDDTWFPRKSADKQDSTFDEPDDEDAQARETGGRGTFPSLGRPSNSNTPTASSFGNAAALWASTNSTVAVGAFGNFALPTQGISGDKRFAGPRGESRLAHLIPKESADSGTTKVADGFGNSELTSRVWRPRQRTDTDPFGSEEAASTSAGLGGPQDPSSPPSAPPQLQRPGVFDTPVKGSTGEFGMANLALGPPASDANGPLSPSETNPYRSPPAERGDDDRGQPGVSAEPAGANSGSFSRAFPSAAAFEGSDRSQTSSVSARGFPALNTMTGWPAAQTSATPDRERPALTSPFGTSIFSPVDSLQSPGLSPLTGVFGPTNTNLAPTGHGRGSKLQALFPGLQQQTPVGPQDQDSLGDFVPDARRGSGGIALGAIGRGPIGGYPHARETDSPLRSGRGAFDEMFPETGDAARPSFGTPDAIRTGTGSTSSTQAQAFPTIPAATPFGSAQQPLSAPSNLVRTMVLPDRMRWEYLDPQGTRQGPFSGLEMHDWYKAHFFSPDLRVRKVEDHEFEPLGQLIRRIGNSREPFLVPQMGVPHGPPADGASPFGAGDARGGIVPPLQSAFPTFGRTLTADEQNNLERRKQEEQQYQARQREYAHQQQAFGRFHIQQPSGMPTPLHHHSSAHSLQSQPSFGSMTSPIGMPPPPPAQAPIGAFSGPASFFEPHSSVPATDMFAPDLNPGERQVLANMQAAGSTGSLAGILPPSQPVNSHAGAGGVSGDAAGAGVRGQLPSLDQLSKDPQGFGARLSEFQRLRNDPVTEDPGASFARLIQETASADAKNQVPAATGPVASSATEASPSTSVDPPPDVPVSPMSKSLTLTQQVQKAQIDAASAVATVAAVAVSVAATTSQAVPQQQQTQQNPNQQQRQVSTGLPMAFPPPSGPTIVAPTAQRTASTLPARFEDRSPSGTPDTPSDVVTTTAPPAAPWAATETHKGPSLREIQEAEAKKAARQEEAAAAMRRAALEYDVAAIRKRDKIAAQAALNTGLAATSTWGIGGSSPPVASTNSAWKQSAGAKNVISNLAAGAPTTGPAPRKTLADIQREEEARKQHQQQQRAQQAQPAQSSVPTANMAKQVKRYADQVASAQVAAPQVGSSAWVQVGSGGKPLFSAPTGPAAQNRPAGAKPVQAPKPTAAKPLPMLSAKETAKAELVKWLSQELAAYVKEGVDLTATILELPQDRELVRDFLYQGTKPREEDGAMADSGHLADEYIRRRKLVDKGVVVPASSAPSAMTGKDGENDGWNEVPTKKGSNREDAGGAPGGRRRGKK